MGGGGLFYVKAILKSIIQKHILPNTFEHPLMLVVKRKLRNMLEYD